MFSFSSLLPSLSCSSVLFPTGVLLLFSPSLFVFLCLIPLALLMQRLALVHFRYICLCGHLNLCTQSSIVLLSCCIFVFTGDTLHVYSYKKSCYSSLLHLNRLQINESYSPHAHFRSYTTLGFDVYPQDSHLHKTTVA